MQPSDSRTCIGLGYGRPVHLGLPRGGGFFFAEPLARRRPAARASADARRVGDGSPAPRCSGSLLVDRRGPPRCLGRPLRACRGPGPRRIRRPLAHDGDADAAEKRLKTPGSRDQTIPRLTTRGSRVRTPTHRQGTSPRPGARLATGLLGSALAGRASHPLDDEQDFVNLPLAYSFLTSLAWSHSTTVRLFFCTICSAAVAGREGSEARICHATRLDSSITSATDAATMARSATGAARARQWSGRQCMYPPRVPGSWVGGGLLRSGSRMYSLLPFGALGGASAPELASRG
jgi:hypothetical protein